MAANIVALLDKAKVVHRLPSDYKLALVMGVQQATLANYRQGKTLPDARVIRLICDLTGDDPALLLAEVEAERAKTDEARALWLEVVKRLRSTLHGAIFSVLVGGAAWGGFPSESQAAERSICQLKTLYIVEAVRRTWHRLKRHALVALMRYGSPLFARGNHVQSAASTAAA